MPDAMTAGPGHEIPQPIGTCRCHNAFARIKTTPPSQTALEGLVWSTQPPKRCLGGYPVLMLAVGSLNGMSTNSRSPYMFPPANSKSQGKQRGRCILNHCSNAEFSSALCPKPSWMLCRHFWQTPDLHLMSIHHASLLMVISDHQLIVLPSRKTQTGGSARGVQQQHAHHTGPGQHKHRKSDQRMITLTGPQHVMQKDSKLTSGS